MGKSRSSVSKYLAEIEAICPEVVIRAGRSTKLSRDGMGSTSLLDRFEPYLRSPVSRRFRISYGVPTSSTARARAFWASPRWGGVGLEIIAPKGLALYKNTRVRSRGDAVYEELPQRLSFQNASPQESCERRLIP